MIEYHVADERPAWKATVTVNGTADDMSTGYTYQVKIYRAGLADDPTATLLTKTTNITGATGGVVTVAWAPNDLAIAEGLHVAQLKASRTSDSAEWTITELIRIKPRA